MKERPIFFSGEMVRAILDGRKTQTRRVLKPQPEGRESQQFSGIAEAREYLGPKNHGKYGAYFGWDFIPCPYGRPGDRLWVRETWAYEWEGSGCPDDDGILYRATDPGWDDNETGLRWRPSIHMPREFSRITLEITGVRAERLQDISNSDALAEGCPSPDIHPREWFVALCQSINGPDLWDANPWVWVIEFQRKEAA